MLRISDARIDGFIAEDVPYVDLTCAVLGIGDEPGEMDYFTREDCVLAGTEVVRRIMGKLGCEVESAEPSGTRVAAGGTFMTVRGTSADLHAAWKVCLNVFDHHLTFFGGFDAFVEQLPAVKARCIEKKLFVEADAERARVLAAAGVDGIQFDKIPPEELATLVAELRAIDPHVTLVAAGGINPGNAAAYAATGVDGLATTAPFAAKPLDMSVRMRRL